MLDGRVREERVSMVLAEQMTLFAMSSHGCFGTQRKTEGARLWSIVLCLCSLVMTGCTRSLPAEEYFGQSFNAEHHSSWQGEDHVQISLIGLRHGSVPDLNSNWITLDLVYTGTGGPEALSMIADKVSTQSRRDPNSIIEIRDERGKPLQFLYGERLWEARNDQWWNYGPTSRYIEPIDSDGRLAMLQPAVVFLPSTPILRRKYNVRIDMEAVHELLEADRHVLLTMEANPTRLGMREDRVVWPWQEAAR